MKELKEFIDWVFDGYIVKYQTEVSFIRFIGTNQVDYTQYSVSVYFNNTTYSLTFTVTEHVRDKLTLLLKSEVWEVMEKGSISSMRTFWVELLTQ